ncbi:MULTISPECIES: 6-phosphogluconolactonase [unclassified Gemella]|uniref:6-phosphogluconolactonase n=1 Tax=unclassified Gemella TaxID=2624949 RepID=UPI001C045ADE|nr:MULTISPECIES: glucosamine-6-phosphate isomerase [unclassified Gemella]MBU0278399.1 glucosamine-6-phosphate isomerase [Gemella sp. zg-1178]QWQ38985.1 glucosamine-6-phosphate isomerase [Gemella sp. zg-570]
MKYIVCNSEQAVFNRVYDELEKFIEAGAVFSFSEKILGSQFEKRIVDEHINGKYNYNHVIFIGQKEFLNMDKEEDFGLYRLMRKNLYKPLEVDYKNIFSPEYQKEEDIYLYKEILKENPIDVAILFIDKAGYILNYNRVTEENSDVHIYELSSYEKNNLIEKYGFKLNSDKVVAMGYDNIMSARNIFLIAIGSDKKEYVANIFEENEDKSPISLLKNHKNLTIFVDKDAGYKSEEEVNKLIKEKQRKKKELVEQMKVEKYIAKEDE